MPNTAPYTCRKCQQPTWSATEQCTPCGRDLGPCARCGTPVTGQRSRHGKTIYCSRACGLTWRTGGVSSEETCPVCGKQFKRDHDQLTCSRACSYTLRGFNSDGTKPKPAKQTKTCVVCEGPITTSARLYCSDQCRIDKNKFRIQDLYSIYLSLGVTGTQWRNVLVRHIQQRDGNKCQICKRAIKFDLPSGPRGHASGLGVSIDHVIPRSLNGSDELSNLRLTHWKCNWLRRTGKHDAPIQLALI